MATSSMEMAKLRSRAYVKIDELSKAISNGLSLQNRKMGVEESESSAEHIINFFG